MTTTTITPEVVATTSRGAHYGALLKSFWLKVKGTALAGLTYAKGFVSRLLGMVPAPITALATPVVLTTRWGYKMLGKGFGLLGWLAGKAVTIPASLVHWGIDFAGEWIYRAIKVFSLPAANKFNRFMVDFSEKRLIAAGFVLALTRAAKAEVADAFNAPTTRGAVALTSAAVAGTVVLGMAAPGVFTSLLTALPAAAATVVAGVATGGVPALALIAGAGLSAMLYRVLKPLVSRKPKALEAQVADIVEAVPVTVPEVTAEVEQAVKESEKEWKADINKPSPTKKHNKR